MDLLHTKLGDQVAIADGQFTVTGVIEHDSNQELGFSGFSPTVMIHQSDIAKTTWFRSAAVLNIVCSWQVNLNRSKLLRKSLSSKNQLQHSEQQQDQQFENNEQSSLKLRDANQSNTRLMKPD